MLAFHNDAKIKQKYLARVTAHERADEIIKGQYWKNGKGCAVGCTIHSDQHADYETELGIPQILARLEDGVFENLPNDLAQTWPRRFLDSISPGVDLSNIWPQFAVWLILDEKYGVLQFAKTDQQREVIQAIGDLYVIQVSGEQIGRVDWQEARTAAAAAAYDAEAAAAATPYATPYDATADAYAAAYAAAVSAATAAAAVNTATADAYAAAVSAATAAAVSAATAAAYAADAADAAADAYAWRAKREEWRIAQSEKLLELLRAQ